MDNRDFNLFFYRRDGRKRALLNGAIIIINILVFLYLTMLGDTTDAGFMYEHGASFAPSVIEGGEYERLLYSMFMHFGFPHLFNNMLVLFFLGDNLERAVGKIGYLLVYMGSGLAGAYMSAWWNYHTGSYAVSAGASGAIFGVLGGLIFVLILHKGKHEDLTLKRMLLFVGLTLYSGLTSSGVDNIAHLGGLIAGFLICPLVAIWHKER